MHIKHDPAFALSTESHTTDYHGLSKREYAAIHILAGMLAGGLNSMLSKNERAEEAVKRADALFEALADVE